MSPAAPRRPSRSTLLIVGVLVIGIAGIVYSRVRQAPDAGAVAATSLAGANTAVLKGTFDPKAQALIPADYRFVTPVRSPWPLIRGSCRWPTMVPTARTWSASSRTSRG